MLDKIESANKGFTSDIAEVKNSDSLEAVRIKYLGRKGLFTELFEEFKQLPKEEKPKYGQILNKTKSSSQKKFDDVKNQLNSSSSESNESIDLSLPGRKLELGSTHILTQTHVGSLLCMPYAGTICGSYMHARDPAGTTPYSRDT